jgi:putative heme-binding domain-containing protein
MNTDERRSAARSCTTRWVFDPLGVHRCSSAVRFFVAPLITCGIIAIVFSSGSVSARLTTSQTETLTAKMRDPQFIAEGAKLFAPNCGSGYCHGVGGIGGGAPRLRGKDLDPKYIFKTVSNGISGTAMLSFKSDFSEEEIWKVVAFILSYAKVNPIPEPSSAKPSLAPASAPPHSDTAPAGILTGSAQAGKALFFDSAQSKSCQACHGFNKEGGAVGPDLSHAGNKPARQLFSLTLMARPARDSRYAVLTLVLKNGDKILGVKKEEDSESVRLYDIAELPAVLRTVQKSDISKSETVDWPVHKDNASLYTIKQLLDLVTFLKSSESKSSVTLADIL